MAEGVWHQPEGFTFTSVPAGRSRRDERGPPENLHVLICKIGIITSILKGWFEIKLDEVCKSMIYTLYQQQNAHKTESILNICGSREHGSQSKQ